jgi:polyhydroxyalkanoate synthase
MTDHVAPWHSVYKIVALSDTEVTFLLTSGGHNAGVVSPPGMQGRSYQIATHGHDASYVAPDTWVGANPLHEGSWWPAWEGWLADRAGPLGAPPAAVRGLGDAPGLYVLQP